MGETVAMACLVERRLPRSGALPHADFGRARTPTEPDEVLVWTVSLDVDADRQRAYRSLLSTDELDRASRFRFDRHRARYIVGRGVLRNVLASSLGARPTELTFACGPFGKPELAGAHRDSGLHFNLAHCEDLALVAVSAIGSVGVDVEILRPVGEMDELVRRFFAPAEAAEFRQLDPKHKPEAFFNLWTRKEALLKATGQGIAHCLAKVEVEFLPGRPARIRRLPAEFGAPGDWVLHDLRPAPGAVGALALRRPAGLH